jgi:hypothetical protein
MRGLGWLLCAMPVLLGASAPAPPACTLTPAEQHWVDGSLSAWNWVYRTRLGLSGSPQTLIVLFNNQCRFEARLGDRMAWKGVPHKGSVALPDGDTMPPAVTSYASADDKTGQVYFVMALPEIWEAAGKFAGDPAGLTAVFLHEFGHTSQVLPLKPVFDAAKAGFPVPEPLNDDRIQALFGADPVYVAVWEKERDLLYAAAHEPDDAKARKLAAQAHALIVARQKRWFTGGDAVWKGYDDLFLTMEGFGQFAAYAWLADPGGGRLSKAEAEKKMRGRWWSQDEGLGLFVLLDRFVPDWPARMFAPKPALGVDLLAEIAKTPG